MNAVHVAHRANGRFIGPLRKTVQRLVKEHKFKQINRRYGELRADPDEWASYQAEARLTDNAAGDGLPSAAGEYPEYNQ